MEGSQNVGLPPAVPCFLEWTGDREEPVFESLSNYNLKSASVRITWGLGKSAANYSLLVVAWDVAKKARERQEGLSVRILPEGLHSWAPLLQAPSMVFIE